MTEPPDIPHRDDDELPAHLRGLDGDPEPEVTLRNVDLDKKPSYARITSDAPPEEPPPFPFYADEPITTPPPPSAPAGPKRLRRSSNDRMLAGVCGGMAEYFRIDATIVRLGAIAAAIFGPGIPVYLLAWLIVPSADGAQRRDREGLTFAQFVLRSAIVVAACCVVPVLLAATALAAASGNGAAVASAVIVIGAALVASAYWGGARWLIPAGLVLALPLAVVSAADLDLEGGVGERTHTPQSLDTVKGEYTLGMGHLTVDLSDVEFKDGKTKRVHVDVGIGEAEVIVPDDVCVSVLADVGVGAVTFFDSEEGGLDVTTARDYTPAKDRAELFIESEIGMGHLVIGHASSSFFAGSRTPRLLHGDGSDAELQPACLSGSSASTGSPAVA